MVCLRREGKSRFLSQFCNSFHQGGCCPADCRQNKAGSCWAEMATKLPVLSPAAESEVLLSGDNCTHPCPASLLWLQPLQSSIGKYSVGHAQGETGGTHLPPGWFPYTGTLNLACLRPEGSKNHVCKKHKEIKA